VPRPCRPCKDAICLYVKEAPVSTESQSSILIVEDDANLRSVLERTLRFEGYEVTTCNDGVAALAELHEARFDAVVMDVSMPNLDGFGLCRRMRERDRTEPVLMLTARTDVADRVHGLDAGADDYLVKPFSIEELLARVRALLRRPSTTVDAERHEELEPIRVGELVIDPRRRTCSYGNDAIDLTKIEFDLLEVLARNADVVIERSRLYDLVWGFDFVPTSRTLDATISYVRSKIEADGRPRLIRTVRGIGYVLRPPS
jgi:two-component system response regulator MprA